MTIAALLAADATLVATATGEVWTLSDTGPDGLNRTTTPGAFDSSGRIKPTVLVRARSSGAEGPADEGERYQPLREMVEVWFYEHAGYAEIEAMRLRVMTLLHEQQIAGTFAVQWAGDVRNQYDDALQEHVERSEYVVRTYWQP